MASIVNQMIGSTDLGGGLIPTEYSNQIIQDIPKQSVMLSRANSMAVTKGARYEAVPAKDTEAGCVALATTGHGSEWAVKAIVDNAHHNTLLKAMG